MIVHVEISTKEFDRCLHLVLSLPTILNITLTTTARNPGGANNMAAPDS